MQNLMDGFTPLSISLDGDDAWPELRGQEYGVGALTHVAILPMGTTGGKPSVAIRGRLEPNGEEVVLQTTWNLLYTAARAIEARYGPGGVTDSTRTVLKAPSLADVTRELREHHKAHGHPPGCSRCFLWEIYTRGSRHELDAFLNQTDLYEADLLAYARSIRHAWGEGDWTNP